MNTTIKRIIVGALLSGGVAAAGLGLGEGTAAAQNPPVGTWCPGQPTPAGPMGWDPNVCHTFWYVPFGKGNVPLFDLKGNPMDSYVWADSPPPPMGPPPPPPPRPAHCPPWNVIIGPSECGGL
jgi:hypothetical protein